MDVAVPVDRLQQWHRIIVRVRANTSDKEMHTLLVHLENDVFDAYINAVKIDGDTERPPAPITLPSLTDTDEPFGG